MPLCSNLSAIRTFMMENFAAEIAENAETPISRCLRSPRAQRLNHVAQQSIPQLRLKPRRLRRHDFARVRDRHQLVDSDWIQRERDRRLARVHVLLELARA